MENKTRLLIVDDEALLCEMMGLHFKRRGYDVFTATSGAQAIALAKGDKPQVMLIDKRMPGMDGVEALEAIRQFNQCVKVFFISAEGLDAETENRIKGLQVSAYMQKPLVMEELDSAVKKAALLSPLNNDFAKSHGSNDEEKSKEIPAQEPLGCVL